MIAIFSTESEAIAYSNKIHEYLTANRPRYNAIKWCDPEKSIDGLEWFVKQPIEEIEDKWETPITTASELSKADDITAPIPEFGIECLIGKHYLYKGGIVKCRQTHNRTIYDPKDTPALFSFFRDNSESLVFIEGEQVEVGWVRIYEGVKYEVIQAHQTQSDWTPNNTPTLWKVWTDPNAEPEVSEWVQPTGAHDAYRLNDLVLFNNKTWKCISDYCVYAPGVFGWEVSE